MPVLVVMHWGLSAGSIWGETAANSYELPARGICAHRGASQTHPENTLAALREAVRLGAHMIEFDVRRTRDGQLVLMHDRTVDRTTNGTGAVADLTLDELRKFDAGSWKNLAFQGEPIPTLDEALAIMPENVWLNVHLKGGVELAEEAARRIAAHDRLQQALLACSAEAARAARRVDPRIKIGNMDRQTPVLKYAQQTVEMRADFIQFLAAQPPNDDAIELLRRHAVRINYCCASEPGQLRQLFDVGVEFVLVDDVAPMLAEAERLGIPRLQPAYRPSRR